MAIPAQFQKHSPSPGDRAAGKSSPPSAKEDSPAEALDILSSAVGRLGSNKTQAQSALSTLRSALEGSGSKSAPSASTSPGQKAAGKFMPKK